MFSTYTDTGEVFFLLAFIDFLKFELELAEVLLEQKIQLISSPERLPAVFMMEPATHPATHPALQTPKKLVYC